MSPSDSPHPHYVSLSSQVGGHPGVMTTEDGSLLFKPALPVEVEFYQHVLANASFEPLRPYIPKFYGTLRLEGEVDQENSPEGAIAVTQASVEAIKNDEKDTSVLENISHTFLRPNILDIKLGRVLYDRHASEEKRARMEKVARETTSWETGVRLTGFQVYDVHKGIPVHTGKSYGKSIKPADLPDGIASFFPVATGSETANTPDSPPVGTGLPADVLLPILESLREDIAEIRQALSEVEMRMAGGSLLIVYEADVERAKEGLKEWLEGESEQEEDEDEESDSDEDRERKPGPPYVVKLIDFAHTGITPGEGPDESTLYGVDTVLKLLDGRIEQVKAIADPS